MDHILTPIESDYKNLVTAAGFTLEDSSYLIKILDASSKVV